MSDTNEWLGLLITLSAFWHVLGFAFGLVYIHFSLRSLFGVILYDRSWTKIIRSADLHLWLSGFALIGLGIWQKGLEVFIANPKLWCKVTVVVIWLISTVLMRRIGIPALKSGNKLPMLRLAAINISCWIYGAVLGCAKPLAFGVVSYPAFLAGFATVMLVCFAVIQHMERRIQTQRLRRTSTSSTNVS